MSLTHAYNKETIHEVYDFKLTVIIYRIVLVSKHADLPGI